MNNKISDKDKKDWEDFLSKKDKLYNKDINNSKTEINKTITFDLHGYSLDDANKKVEDLINQSFEVGIKKLIIITGKGLHSENEKDPYVSKKLGILKYSIPEYIRNNEDLINKITKIDEANISDGGKGAFYIYLKKKL